MAMSDPTPHPRLQHFVKNVEHAAGQQHAIQQHRSIISANPAIDVLINVASFNGCLSVKKFESLLK